MSGIDTKYPFYCIVFYRRLGNNLPPPRRKNFEVVVGALHYRDIMLRQHNVARVETGTVIDISTPTSARNEPPQAQAYSAN
jgi:hypothetical protein